MDDLRVNTLYPKVLSIQSSVVFGYVGNKASVYGLQARNIEVDPLNTCQLSNHTGYDSWAGPKTTGEELTTIINGMDTNALLSQYTHILAGYIATPSFISALPAVVHLIKKRRAEYAENSSFVQEDGNVVFLCDPVLGDNGSMYVPTSSLSVYKDELVPLSDIVTPNETELALLVRDNNQDAKKIPKFNSLDEVLAGCVRLHQMGPKLVIVTSMDNYFTAPDENIKFDISIPAGLDHGLAAKCLGLSSYEINRVPRCVLDAIETGLQPVNTIGCLISYFNPTNNEYDRFYIRVPRFDGYIVGTGDLTASLILSHLQQAQFDYDNAQSVGENISIAIGKAIATIHSVIRGTLIRSFVGKHCTTCELCLAKQNINKKNIPIDMLEKLESVSSPETVQIRANLVTEPLELWLPGCNAEFLNPSCVVTPIKL